MCYRGGRRAKGGARLKWGAKRVGGGGRGGGQKGGGGGENTPGPPRLWKGVVQLVQPRLPHTGQALIPWLCSTFSATRICSSRDAPAGEPLPPLARHVPIVNCRPP